MVLPQGRGDRAWPILHRLLLRQKQDAGKRHPPYQLFSGGRGGDHRADHPGRRAGGPGHGAQHRQGRLLRPGAQRGLLGRVPAGDAGPAQQRPGHVGRGPLHAVHQLYQRLYQRGARLLRHGDAGQRRTGLRLGGAVQRRRRAGGPEPIRPERQPQLAAEMAVSIRHDDLSRGI